MTEQERGPQGSPTSAARARRSRTPVQGPVSVEGQVVHPAPEVVLPTDPDGPDTPVGALVDTSKRAPEGAESPAKLPELIIPTSAASAALDSKETPMSTTTVDPQAFVSDVQKVVLENVKKTQDAFLEAFGGMSEYFAAGVQAFPQPANFSAELPKPEALIANVFDFSSAVLAAQRQFAEKFLAVLPR